MRWYRWILLALGIAIVPWANKAWARSNTVLGGLARTGYVYTGQQGKSIFFYGSTHDLRTEGSGLLGYSNHTFRRELDLAIRVGGLAAVNFAELRSPIARSYLFYRYRVSPLLNTSAQLDTELEPYSSGQAQLSENQSLSGQLGFLANAAINGEWSIDRRNLLTTLLQSQLFYLLSDHYQLTGENVGATYGIQPELVWEHALRQAAHRLEMRTSGRIMNARSVINPPLTGWVGGQLGYQYRREDRFTFLLRTGVSRMVNYRYSHLWPVEPLADLNITLFNRREFYELAGGCSVREHIYSGGLPARLTYLRLGATRLLTTIAWRWGLDGIYEVVRYASGRVIQGSHDGHDLHVGRLRARIYWPIGKNWRVFTEMAANYGWEKRDFPTTCGDGTCPTTGFYLNSWLGIAYLIIDQPVDERLLTQVW